MHACTSANRLLPVVVPFIDRIAASSSVILKSDVIPRTNMSNCAVSRTSQCPMFFKNRISLLFCGGGPVCCSPGGGGPVSCSPGGGGLVCCSPGGGGPVSCSPGGGGPVSCSPGGGGPVCCSPGGGGPISCSPGGGGPVSCSPGGGGLVSCSPGGGGPVSCSPGGGGPVRVGPASCSPTWHVLRAGPGFISISPAKSNINTSSNQSLQG
uniref:Uncharacterized protein n=1 Tax=Fundulus heteroclitus TaxID=8078 RepID=A0A3Q2Q9E6_FUNHE